MPLNILAKRSETVTQRCSVNKCVLKNLRPATFLIKRIWHRCFPVNFAKFLRKLFFVEHVGWLLLQGPEYASESVAEITAHKSLIRIFPEKNPRCEVVVSVGMQPP